MWDYVAIPLLGGVVSMDTTSGPQLLVSEPVVSCTILGFLLGEPWVGFMFGIFMQFLWFGYMPLGAARLIDGNMASYIAAAGLLISGARCGYTMDDYRIAFVPAIMLSSLVGHIGEFLTTQVRHWNGTLSAALTERLEHEYVASIGAWHMRGVALSFSRGLGMTLVLTPLMALALCTVRWYPEAVTEALYYASDFIWGAVAAFAIVFYWMKGRQRYLVLGMLGGLTWLLVTMMK